MLFATEKSKLSAFYYFYHMIYEYFKQNWLWVMLIDLAMSNIELHFGEMMITANQNDDFSYNNYPTKEIARMLASCLNR